MGCLFFLADSDSTCSLFSLYLCSLEKASEAYSLIKAAEGSASWPTDVFFAIFECAPEANG